MVAGRPSKLKSFTEALEQLLNKNEMDIIVLTDEELRIECNELLEEDKQISDRTFENWKAGDITQNEEYVKFLRLYKKALHSQKRRLFEKFEKDGQWQKYAWILERKFNEWNLKNINENDNKNSGEIIFKIKS